MPAAEFFTVFGLFVRRDVFDAGLCKSLRDEIRRSPGHASTVAEQSGDAVDDAYRRTVSADVSAETHTLVRGRLEDLLPELSNHFGVELTEFQPPQFLLYREGHFFRPHADREDDAPDYVRRRRVSAVIFLNGEGADAEPDSYSGGALTFFGLMGDARGDQVGFPLTGEPGLLVAFPSELVHSVAPVSAGERFTIVSWFW
ncbi:MAG: 2OG-Fe(II) oxygenase [Thermoleophilia bacterium]|nr:2OG-Fe(II) oxygenase [Thermoleophilia bacterium]